MAKESVLITGDWDEGYDLATESLKSLSYEIHRIDITDIRTAIKKKGCDAIIFSLSENKEEIKRRVEDIKKFHEGLPIFVFSKMADVPFAVDCINSGASDFFVRPLEDQDFAGKVKKAVHLYGLTQKIFLGGKASLEGYIFENMIGRSQKMQDNFQMIAAVAKSNATVLITGESGVGKELVAQAIHRLSDRAAEKFVDINCGAIPKDLLENELFGHEKGAYTGAHKRYVGSFERAHKGSLFLDEISEMDVLLQVKLLRVLQERNFSRIGGTDKINVDVRIIAATNRNLQKFIDEGRFREDLYYRLNVINIEIPSLRERREDIPLLAKHFLDYYATKNNRIALDFSNEAMEALINYDWPGNVRELENTVERIVILNDVSQIRMKHLPPQIQKVDRSIGYSEDSQALQDSGGVIPLEELERQAIEAALLKFHGNVAVAAKKLKIGQATLYRKVKKFGIVT